MYGKILSFKTNPIASSYRPLFLDRCPKGYRHFEIELNTGHIFTTNEKFPTDGFSVGDEIEMIYKRKKLKKIKHIE